MASQSVSSPPAAATNPYLSTLDSLMRITLAGFGGALAGLSLSRRGAASISSSSSGILLSSSSSSAISKNNGVVGTTVTTNTSSAVNAAKREWNKMNYNKNNATTATNTAATNTNTAATATRNNKTMPRHHRPIRTTPPSSRPYVDRELPAAWAMACMSFTAIIEFTRAVSPTSLARQIVDILNNDGSTTIGGVGSTTGETNKAPPPPTTDNDTTTTNSNGNNNNTNIDCSLTTPSSININTISDYAIGGAFAGALFKGSAVRTRAGARMDASMLLGGNNGNIGSSSGSSAIGGIARGGSATSGILPGAALGLVAGVTIVTMEYLQVALEDHFGSLEEQENNDDDDDADGNNGNDGNNHGNNGVDAEELSKEDTEEIPADIKGMTNEELMKSIEDLKKGKKDDAR